MVYAFSQSCNLEIEIKKKHQDLGQILIMQADHVQLSQNLTTIPQCINLFMVV